MLAQIAAYTSHAAHDPQERTRAAASATPTQRPYWVRKVRSEQPALDDAEVTRRAELLHKAYMKRLSLASSRARGARTRRQAADTGTADRRPAQPGPGENDVRTNEPE
jgi:hypothetical protein